MIIKLIGGLIFMLSSAGFSLCMNKENKIKIAGFENFKKCVDTMKNDMCISLRSFYEALESAIEYADVTNKFIFTEILECKNEDNDVLLCDKIESTLSNLKKYNFYNDKDIHVLKNISNIISNSNIACLEGNFEYFTQEIDNRITELNSDIKNKALFGKIAIYVSFIIVVFLF